MEKFTKLAKEAFWVLMIAAVMIGGSVVGEILRYVADH